MTISFFISWVSGSWRIFTGSLPAMQAAAWSSSPPAAPLHTNPASAPVMRAISCPAARFSSSMFTITRAACDIKARVSGRVRVPPSRVMEPAALIIG